MILVGGDTATQAHGDHLRNVLPQDYLLLRHLPPQSTPASSPRWRYRWRLPYSEHMRHRCLLPPTTTMGSAHMIFYTPTTYDVTYLLNRLHLPAGCLQAYTLAFFHRLPVCTVGYIVTCATVTVSLRHFLRMPLRCSPGCLLDGS